VSGHGESEEQSSEVQERTRRSFFPFFSSLWCYFGCCWYCSRTPLFFSFLFLGEMITELRLFRKSWWQGVHSRCVSLVEVQRLGTEEHLENLTVGSRGPELWRKLDIIRKPANLLFLGFLLHAWYAYSLVFPFFFLRIGFLLKRSDVPLAISSHMSSILRSSPGNRMLINPESMIFRTEFSWFGNCSRNSVRRLVLGTVLYPL